jgi:hypothetical protein
VEVQVLWLDIIESYLETLTNFGQLLPSKAETDEHRSNMATVAVFSIMAP